MTRGTRWITLAGLLLALAGGPGCAAFDHVDDDGEHEPPHTTEYTRKPASDEVIIP